MEYLGTETGGRYFPLERIKPGMVMLSFGVGEDISFELEMMDRGVIVHCFDPTPKSVKYIKSLGRDVSFYAWGIACKSGKHRFYLPANRDYVSCSIVNLQGTADYFTAQCYTLADIMHKIGLDHIDILKLDIEGLEYQLLDQIELPPILMVEFHSNGDPTDFAWMLTDNYSDVFVNGQDHLFL